MNAKTTKTTKTNATKANVGFIKSVSTKAYVATVSAAADTAVVVEALYAVTPKVWDNARAQAASEMDALFAELGI